MAESTDRNKPWQSVYNDEIPHELPIPAKNTIEQFRETVERLPNAPAVYYFDTTITFKEIDELSNSLAFYLHRIGVEKGDRIAIYMQNIPQFWIAQLAGWKAGAIVVPLNVMFKAEELIYHLNDAGATVLICMETLYETYVKSILPSVSVDYVITTCELDLLNQPHMPDLLAISKKIKNLGTPDLIEICKRFNYGGVINIPVETEEIAMLVYTSGTIGQPKGAMISHGNIAFNAEVYKRWIQIDSEDVIIGGSPLFHITGQIAHLALSALAGIPIILSCRFEAGEILRLIEKWKGTFSVMPITTYMSLLYHPDLDRRDTASMAKIYSGGASIPEAAVQAFQKGTGAYIHGVYGLTETTSPSHAVPYRTNARYNPEAGVLSVGLPVPNCISKVVNPTTGDELEPGEIGEIVIKGPMVVKGYWNKPEDSKKAIKNGWLYTGDVGLMDEQGWFYVIDRMKDAIIASGFKVWPREVEEVLYKHPAVKEAAVVGVADEYRGETVKAFVSLNADVSIEDLIGFCRARLASFKAPRQIVVIDEIPKTATGKFLRRLLRENEISRLQAIGTAEEFGE